MPHTRRVKSMVARRPCETLKLLHKRSGLSGEELAKAMGKGGKTSYFRYEDPGRMGERPIPWRVIEMLIPVMVGKGDPPITADELVRISDAKNFRSVGRVQLHPALADPGSPGPVSRAPNELVGAGIPLRYRAERGSYTDTALLESKSYGPSVIAAANEWPVDRQFAVMIGDHHAMPDFGAGDVLHCVRGESPAGSKKVVISAERGGLGIAEILVGSFQGLEGQSGVRVSVGQSNVAGTILGVVVGAYRRVD